MTAWLRTVLAILLLAAAGTVAAGAAAPDTGEVTVVGVFEDGTSVFPGARVRVMGVDVGFVTEVTPVRGVVHLTFTVDEAAAVPADSGAVVMPLTVLGERYVQLLLGSAETPLADGDVIPLERTSKPPELDELLAALRDFTSGIDADAAADAVTNLATLLEGQGEDVGQLVEGAADTIGLLASEHDALRSLLADLASTTSTLADRRQVVTTFLRDYAALSDTLADEQALLSDAVLTSRDAMEELTRFLVANQAPLGEELEALTTAGRTIDRSLDHVEELVVATERLMSVPERAWDREKNVLRINGQFSDQQQTNRILATRISDRMAGVCRRVAAQTSGDEAASALCEELTDELYDAVIAQLFPSDPPPFPPTFPPAGAADTSTGSGGAPAPPRDLGAIVEDLVTLLDDATMPGDVTAGGLP